MLKLGGEKLSVFVPLSDPGKCISVSTFSSEEPLAQDRDFHMLMQIRTPWQRYLKRFNNPGKCLEAVQKRESSVRGRRRCLWLTLAAVVVDDALVLAPASLSPGSR